MDLQEKIAELSKRRKIQKDDKHVGGTGGAGEKISSKSSVPAVQAPPIAHTSVLDADQQLESDHASLLESIADVEFNGIVVGSSKPHNPEAGKPGSKMKRLKRMLEEADAKRERLASLQKQGEVGKQQSINEQWSDALKDASGVKSVNDTKKLRKAIKSREKSKERSTREWGVRAVLPVCCCAAAA